LEQTSAFLRSVQSLYPSRNGNAKSCRLSIIFDLFLRFHRKSGNYRSRLGLPGIEPDNMFETDLA
jgi:hypothetical protein